MFDIKIIVFLVVFDIGTFNIMIEFTFSHEVMMEDVIRPIRVLAKITALEGSNSKIHICKVAIILTVFSVSVILRQILSDSDGNKGIIITLVKNVGYNSRVLTVICALIMSSQRTEIIAGFTTDVSALDKKFNAMGFPVDYSMTKRLGRVLLGSLVIKIGLQQVVSFLKGNNNVFVVTKNDWKTKKEKTSDTWTITDYLDYIIFNISIFITYTLLVQWTIYLTILRIHFKILNNILKTHRYEQYWIRKDLSCGKNNSKPKTSTSQKDLIRTCGGIYDNLCLQSEQINDAFAWQILFLIPSLFIVIIFNTFQTCRMIKNLLEFDCRWVIFDILYFLAFLELVIPCVRVREESRKFVDILHKIYLNETDDTVNSLILQTYYQKIEFSACGIFSLDGTLIYKVLGALTTYLVILLQFDLQ